MLITLPAMQFRGGTSKGVYLLGDDLRRHTPSRRTRCSQPSSTTHHDSSTGWAVRHDHHKVAIVAPPPKTTSTSITSSARLTRRPARSTGHPRAATSWGRRAVRHRSPPGARHGDTTDVRIRLVNSGAGVVAAFPTPTRGRGTPPDPADVHRFRRRRRGTLSPTGNRTDPVDGIEVSWSSPACTPSSCGRPTELTGAESTEEINTDGATLDASSASPQGRRADRPWRRQPAASFRRSCWCRTLPIRGPTSVLATSFRRRAPPPRRVRRHRPRVRAVDPRHRRCGVPQRPRPVPPSESSIPAA